MKYDLVDYFETGIVLFCLFAFACVAGRFDKSVTALELVPVRAPWTLSVFDFQGQKVAGYSLDVPHDHASCRINVYDDGAIEAYGYDYNIPGKQVSSAVRLEQGRYGLQKIYSVYSRDKVMPNGFILMAPGGYDVFYVKCRPYVYVLPRKLRAMFHGFFGIE